MVFTSVKLQLHPSSQMVISDIADDGKFYNLGVQTLAALKAHKTIDVHYPEMDGDPAQETIIPYHAVLSWSVTKGEDEYTKPEDDFCKAESTPTDEGITLLDGTYTFSEEDGIGEYYQNLDKCYDPANVTVTVDDVTVTLPKASGGEYGEFDNHTPVFTTFPVAVLLTKSSDGGALSVLVPTAGSHTVKVTVPNGSEVDCGGR